MYYYIISANNNFHDVIYFLFMYMFYILYHRTAFYVLKDFLIFGGLGPEYVADENQLKNLLFNNVTTTVTTEGGGDGGNNDNDEYNTILTGYRLAQGLITSIHLVNIFLKLHTAGFLVAYTQTGMETFAHSCANAECSCSCDCDCDDDCCNDCECDCDDD